MEKENSKNFSYHSEFLIFNLTVFLLLGLVRTSEKSTFVITKDVEKCTVKRLICVLTCGGTLVIDRLFVLGTTVVNALQDPTNFR